MANFGLKMHIHELLEVPLTMDEASLTVLSTVLAYYRAPRHYPKLTIATEPLPQGLTGLLELLNGCDRVDSVMDDVAQQLRVRSDELQTAIAFFIEQVLFAKNADYYRILGVSQGAPIADIKYHYRQLMGIFHPDKMLHDDSWDEQYATQINTAYNTLKNAGKRREYDRGIPPVMQRSQTTKRTRVMRAAKSTGKRTTQTSVFWQHPKLIVSSIIGAGFLLMFLFFIIMGNEPQEALIYSDEPIIDKKPVAKSDARHEAFMRAIQSNTQNNAAEKDLQ